MKQTKEEIIIELTKLRQSHADWVSGDERKRKEFAKAFDWYDNYKGYGSDNRAIRLSSWEEIFVQVGKLLSTKNFYDFEGNLSELECKLENLENKIKKEIHPNL